MPINLKDVLEAFDFSNEDTRIFVCKQTGKVYLHFEFGDNVEDLPDDIDDEAKYVQLPDKRDLGIGRPLVMDFVRDFLPQDFDEVRRIFSRKGAYAHFKDFLRHRDALDRWYHFESKATERALRAWCADNSIEIID